MYGNSNGGGETSSSSSSKRSKKPNPIEKFEESFISCLTSLSKDDMKNSDKDDIKFDLEKSLTDLLETAHDSELYFLKKRLLIESQKPELIVKDESHELRYELMRKEELIRKNMDKINSWQTTLSDIQHQQQLLESSVSSIPSSLSSLTALYSQQVTGQGNLPPQSPVSSSSSSIQGYPQLLQKLTSQPLIPMSGKNFDSSGKNFDSKK